MKIDNITALKHLLEEYGVDLSLWGVGKAKTLEHLWAEIQAGESTLHIDTNQTPERLLRSTAFAGVRVFHTNAKGDRFYLEEVKQVFSDGRERFRTLDVSLAEKMAPKELPLTAAIRGIKEELGLTFDSFGGTMLATKHQVKYSDSYPHLMTGYVSNIFEIELNAEQYNPEGYQEKQEDKTTYFLWTAVPEGKTWTYHSGKRF